MQNLRRASVLVTGGASFIGSHLVEQLVDQAASVRVVDDLSSGLFRNIKTLVDGGDVEFVDADLREPGVARSAVQAIDVLFHLAADHGGRGYLETHEAGPAGNFFLDGYVFHEALRANVGKVVFASSGCVYPKHLQTDPSRDVKLSEDLIGPPYDADNIYGWAKLMAEFQLRSFHREHGLETASCRYFTAYGPREKESHAVMAMIARAFVRKDPFEVWGTGEQVRNWTYIDDIVQGTLRAAETIDDGTAVNIGTTERTTVMGAVRLILELMDHEPEVVTRPEMPVGPLNRVADDSLARSLLGWHATTSFREGIEKTIDWYVHNKHPDEVNQILERGGLERRTAVLTG